MAATMEKTRYTGVFKRGGRYVATWRAGGRQHKRSAATLEEARKLRAAMQGDVARGDFDEQSKLTVSEYGREWVERHWGIREQQRTDYRRLLERFAFPWFDGQVPWPGAPTRALTVSEVRPKHLAQFVRWLADEQAQAGHEVWVAAHDERAAARALKGTRGDERDKAERELAAAQRRLRRLRERKRKGELESKRFAPKTIGNAVVPLRSLFGAAVEEGLARYNPTSRVKLPQRVAVDEDEDHDEGPVRVFTRDQAATLLRILPDRWRLLFLLLLATGLRISELIGLQWKHVVLDGSRPHVKVRRGIVRGIVGPPKSRYGRRDVPLPFEVVSGLRRHRQGTEWPRDTDPVFASLKGTPLEPGNLRRRVLAPAAEEAGVEWAGFHTFRHTCASLLFDRGDSVKAVQKHLGHHKASFTLDTYIHLLSDDVDEPLDVAAELKGGNRVATRPPETSRNGEPTAAPDFAFQSGPVMPAETGRNGGSAS